jgi:hypothetical protein
MTTRTYYVPKDRLTHIQAHLSGGIDMAAVKHIQMGTGSPSACAMRLASHALGHFA